MIVSGEGLFEVCSGIASLPAGVYSTAPDRSRLRPPHVHAIAAEGKKCLPEWPHARQAV
jgi:hypothetical protein